jgi:hypothetical protein
LKRKKRKLLNLRKIRELEAESQWLKAIIDEN